MTKRFNPHPKIRARGIYIPPCGGFHGQETTSHNWCRECREIAYQDKALSLMEEEIALLKHQLEERDYQPRRAYTPPPLSPPPTQENKIPSGGANVRPRSSSTS